ncbi:hypothetical protein HAX54_006323, partial [Datura stramonium]|nr:hypothetical protein [Datura stramonium]
ARRIEQVVQEQVPQPRPATILAQVVMPPMMEEAFNAVKGAVEMFTTFMENQGQRRDQTRPPTGRQDGSMSSRVKEFINLDPPEFCGTKPEQDPILCLGDHIQDTTAATMVSMESFASAVRFAKSLEGKKQKRRVERDQNKKGRKTDGFSGSIGGGNEGVPSKGSLVPAQSMPQTSGSLPSRHSEGSGSQSRQNQNFKTLVS